MLTPRFPLDTPNQDEEEAAAFVANDPYAQAGLFQSTFVTQLAELDVTGQHLDRQWEKFQLEGKKKTSVDGWMDGGMVGSMGCIYINGLIGPTGWPGLTSIRISMLWRREPVLRPRTRPDAAVGARQGGGPGGVTGKMKRRAAEGVWWE